MVARRDKFPLCFFVQDQTPVADVAGRMGLSSKRNSQSSAPVLVICPGVDASAAAAVLSRMRDGAPSRCDR
ncbi:hypothetical protein DLM45_15375 [Hyphomicrobium methylovorum]|nr:hypothetical protein [Hyphomicrobium methylovorum]